MIYDIMELTSESQGTHEVIEEALTNRHLLFNAASLSKIGFHSMDDISLAIERAMAICSCSGLAVKEHFKAVYVSDNDNHTLQKDWKLSKLAYTLVILNGASDNPMVARLQVEMLAKYLTHDKVAL